MAYSTIRNGSSGSDVKTWQEYLISQGYDVGSTGADGKFGAKTLAATKAYQKANGLTVDGIVGKNTWGSMNTSSKTSTKTSTKTTTPTSTYKYEGFKYDPYEKSDTVNSAWNEVEELKANKPGELQFSWQEQLNETIDKILNREKFSYDLNGDALYRQYKDQYTTQGKMAMMDTMGQAAAMTGGYGNSYAQTVGQQTYQGYLQQLNDRVPELYQLALNQYNQESQDLYNQYGLLADRQEYEYGMHRDTVSDYYTDLDYLTGRAETLEDNEREDYWNGVNMDYNIHTATQTAGKEEMDDANELAITMISNGVMPSDDLLNVAGISKTDALALVDKVGETANSSGNTGGSGDKGNKGDKGNTGGNGYDNGSYSTDIVKQAQLFVGASDDGKWGANSASAAEKMGYNSLEEVVKAMDDAPNPSKYAKWTALDWEEYFSTIRINESKEAAEEELEYFNKNGLIPQKFVTVAAIGARGRLGR